MISGVFAASASAQTTTNYHPDAESRTFATRDGGWIGSTSFDNGLCVAGVTCPATDEAFVANGGAGGPADGFLRTEVAGTASLASVAHVTETSPSFVYQGAAGKTPETVYLALDRRVDASTLLAVLDSATYSVVLSDMTSATSLPVINQVAITEQQTWASVPSVAIDPSQLKIGDRYQIQISTDLDFPVAVLPAGTFDYDNVVLRAVSTNGGTAEAEATETAAMAAMAEMDTAVAVSPRVRLLAESAPLS